MSTDIPEIIDALPYIDSLIDDDEDKRLDAMKEVDDEMDVFPPERDYLDYLPAIEERKFKTPLIEHEHSCIEKNEARRPSPNLSSIRTDIPPPAGSNIEDDDTAVWSRCLDQLKIKMEYRQRQLANLDLMKNFDKLAWEQYVSDNEKLSTDLLEENNGLNKKTQEVNWQRKTDQERTFKTLNVLKNEWTSLSYKNRILMDELKKLK